jgi:hypothetical protein
LVGCLGYLCGDRVLLRAGGMPYGRCVGKQI